jgi:hypothetical protein
MIPTFFLATRFVRGAIINKEDNRNKKKYHIKRKNIHKSLQYSFELELVEGCSGSDGISFWYAAWDGTRRQAVSVFHVRPKKWLPGDQRDEGCWKV